MERATYWKNLEYLTGQDQLKFVIANREDYVYAKTVLSNPLVKRNEKLVVNLSPVFNEIELKELATWMLEDKLRARLHIQLHKYIWGENAKGV